MDPDEQERAKVVRGVALSKAFWFRREADGRVGRTDIERSDGASRGMPDVTSDVVQDMDDFMERLARSKWASYPSVRFFPLFSVIPCRVTVNFATFFGYTLEKCSLRSRCQLTRTFL